MLAALCGLEAEGKDREFFKGWILPMLHKLDAAPFLQNPYYTGVKIQMCIRDSHCREAWYHPLAKKVPLRGFRRAKAAGGRGAGADL